MQQPQANGQRPVGLEPATIEGSVLVSTGEKLRRATVLFRPLEWRAEPYAVQTDAEGKFLSPQIEPGRYSILVEKAGFLAKGTGSNRIVKVEPGQKLTLDALTMIPQAVLRGRVLDEEGEPLAGARVRLMKFQWTDGKKSLTGGGFGEQTNDQGEYRIAGVRAGSYVIVCDPVPRRIGRRAGAAGVPIEEEVAVPTFYPGGTEPDTAVEVQVAEGQDLPGLDIRMQKSRALRIKGRVDISAIPADSPSRLVVLRAGEESGPPGLGARGGVINKDGTFEVAGLAPGNYQLRVVGMRRGLETYSMQDVAVGSQNVDGVTLAATLPMTLTGRISGVDVSKIDLSKARVSMSPAGLGGRFGRAQSTVDAKGQFQVESVSIGDYEVTVTGLPANHYVKEVRAGAVPAGSSLAIRAATPVDIVLAGDGGSVSGTVVDADGKPVASATVLLLPSSGPDSGFRKQATSDANGQFSFASAAPAEYKVYAFTDFESGLDSNPIVRRRMERLGSTVKLTAQGSATAQILAAPFERVLRDQ
jgi:hypothetical protein